jgi:hypothetical protein
MRTMIEMAHEVYGEHTFWTEAQLLRLKAFEALVRADERKAIAELFPYEHMEYFGEEIQESIRARGNT